VHKARKFSAVFGTTSANSSNMTRPTRKFLWSIGGLETLSITTGNMMIDIVIRLQDIKI
jgi:hypothetical protein